MKLTDRIYEKLSHRNFRRLEERRMVLEWINPSRNERILDIGCGDGFHDRQMAARGANVVGIDISAQRLAKARRKNEVHGVQFAQMNAAQLDFPDGSFDKVVSFCVIEHFDDDAKVLAEAARVLVPGGRLILSADSLSNPEITSTEREHHRQRYAVNNFYDRHMIGAKLEGAGFRADRMHYLLTTPISLALVRLTWWLDDLPRPLGMFKKGGYLVCNFIGKIISDLSERLAARQDSGLTLLVSATKT
jgi:ubiquinone/menaquinone biosynthesis C-methylase UbiE